VFRLIVSIAAGVAVSLAWSALCLIAIRACGIPVLIRTSEQRAPKKQHMIQMGRLRYVLIFGVIGNGIPYGLGIATAIMMDRYFANCGEGAIIFGVVSLLYGIFNGVKGWNAVFRTEVPFPPAYPPAS